MNAYWLEQEVIYNESQRVSMRWKHNRFCRLRDAQMLGSQNECSFFSLSLIGQLLFDFNELVDQKNKPVIYFSTFHRIIAPAKWVFNI